MTPASDPVVVEDVIRRIEETITTLNTVAEIYGSEQAELADLLADSLATIVKLNTELREAKGLAASRLLEMQSLAKRLDERPSPYAFVPRYQKDCVHEKMADSLSPTGTRCRRCNAILPYY